MGDDGRMERMTIVWVMLLHERPEGECYIDDKTVLGVYSTWQQAQASIENSQIALGSKDGIKWSEDSGVIMGEVETCPKGDYYMFCNCKRLNTWRYSVWHYNLDAIPSEQALGASGGKRQ